MSAHATSFKPASDDTTSTSKMAETAQEAADTAGAKLKDATDAAMEAGAEFADRARTKTVDAYDSIKRFAEEQPVLAVAAVAVTAIAAGAILSRLAQPSRSEALLRQLSDAVEPYTRSLRR